MTLDAPSLRYPIEDIVNVCFWTAMGLSAFFAFLFGGGGAWELDCRPESCAQLKQLGAGLLALTAVLELARVEVLRRKAGKVFSGGRRVAPVLGVALPPAVAIWAPALLTPFFFVGLVVLGLLVVIAYVARK